MRLWSLHPAYLDPRGLAALWREALLAHAVLTGRTRGYQHHPQRLRFRAHPAPIAAIQAYLSIVLREAQVRGYDFDGTKVYDPGPVRPLVVTDGQLRHELRHLLEKLRGRSPMWYRRLEHVEMPCAHPLMRVVAGGVASWERWRDRYGSAPA